MIIFPKIENFLNSSESDDSPFCVPYQILDRHAHVWHYFYLFVCAEQVPNMECPVYGGLRSLSKPQSSDLGQTPASVAVRSILLGILGSGLSPCFDDLRDWGFQAVHLLAQNAQRHPAPDLGPDPALDDALRGRNDPHDLPRRGSWAPAHIAPGHLPADLLRVSPNLMISDMEGFR